MTAKVRNPEYRFTVTNEEKTLLDTVISKSGIEKTPFLMSLIEFIPIMELIKEKGMTIEQTIEKLNKDDNVITIVQTVRKGANEKPFDILLEKIMAYNANCKDETIRIALTPSIFYKIIGGNVIAIKALYDSKITEIVKHNSNMGLDENWNRKLAKRIDSDLYNWIKKTVGFNV